MSQRRLFELSPIDEGLLVWQQANAPYQAQLAVTAPRLDPVRLRAAFNAALAHHPLTSCFVEEDARGRLHWVLDDDADIGEIRVVACATQRDVEELRGQEMGAPLPLDRAPIMRAALARGPERDTVIMSTSHAMCDGLGLYRFLRSVGRVYRGAPDPPPAVDVATARALAEPERATTWSEMTRQWAGNIDLVATRVAGRSRLASSVAVAQDGFGVTGPTLEMPPLTAARRRYDATFDEYLMACLHVTIERWNRAHGAPCESVGVSQGVNLRPAEWWDDVVMNLATFASVVTDPPDRVSIEAALSRIRPQLAWDVRRSGARAVLEAARLVRMAPRGLRRDAMAAAPPNLFDTCVLSNVGVLDDPPRFAEDDEPVIDGATPAMPQVGLTIGTEGHEDYVRFLACYWRERFDEAGVSRFFDLYGEVLLNG